MPRTLLLYPIYSLINLTQMLVIGVHYFKKEIDGKGVLQRFSIGIPNQCYDYWLHCASLGEAKVLVRFAKALLKVNPDLTFLISVQRNSAKDYIEKELNGHFDVIYFPLDALWLWCRFFKKIQVNQLICMESEIWPRLFEAKSRFGLSITLINARISTQSHVFFKKYNFIFRPVFAAIDSLYAQSEKSGKRFHNLGVPASNIKIAGNIKYDLVDPIETPSSQNDTDLKTSANNLTLLFVSTRKGEETLIEPILHDLFSTFDNLRVLIAPRHLNRLSEISEILKNHEPKLFSEVGMQARLSIIDTFGQLNEIYPQSDLVVVGGTLKDFGGHSIIEPASFAKAIVVGPHVDHISDDVELFSQQNAIQKVKVQADKTARLKAALISLLKQPLLREQMGQNAYALVKAQRGVSEKIAKDILKQSNS